MTLCVLFVASRTLERIEKRSVVPAHIFKAPEGLLIVSVLWGAYVLVDSVLFLIEKWKYLLDNAGMIFVFKTIVALATGCWLVIVGGSRVVRFFKAEGGGSEEDSRVDRVAAVLAMAWIVCYGVVFSGMYAYVYLSTFGLLLLGSWGAFQAASRLRSGERPETHVSIRILGALSVSIGFFAFIGFFYRTAFGESWSIVTRQLLMAASFGGIGILFLGNSARVGRRSLGFQLAFSCLAVALVIWRILGCVSETKEAARRWDRLVAIARESGCGRYEGMLYHGSPDDYTWPRKSLDLAEISPEDERSPPNCESIPMEIQITPGGVITGDDLLPLGGDLTSKKHLMFMETLKWGVSQGLILVIDRQVAWKDVVTLVDMARQKGNRRLYFLLRRTSRHSYYPLPDHRLKAKFKDILSQENPFGTGFVYSANIASRISAFCPQVQTELASTCYCDLFEKFEMFARDIPWAAMGCLGDIDLEAMEMSLRCFFRFEPLAVISIPIASPDAAWSQTVALPPELPWELAYRHLLQATSIKREEIPPLLLVLKSSE